MKKGIIGILLIVVSIIIIFFVWYNRNLNELKEIKSFNSKYEEFLDKEILGVDLTTVINMALENNSQYAIAKNKDGTYKDDKKYSIAIIIKPTETRKSISNGSL